MPSESRETTPRSVEGHLRELRLPSHLRGIHYTLHAYTLPYLEPKYIDPPQGGGGEVCTIADTWDYYDLHSRPVDYIDIAWGGGGIVGSLPL